MSIGDAGFIGATNRRIGWMIINIERGQKFFGRYFEQRTGIDVIAIG
jgi:hypothetical protein